jgi:hypothetical protein
MYVELFARIVRIDIAYSSVWGLDDARETLNLGEERNQRRVVREIKRFSASPLLLTNDLAIDHSATRRGCVKMLTGSIDARAYAYSLLGEELMVVSLIPFCVQTDRIHFILAESPV